MSLAKQFLAMSGLAILAYLIVSHATGAGNILNALGSNTSTVYKTLEGR